MKRLFLMLLATVSLIACDKGGDDTPKPIELTGGTTTSQTVYADETVKSDGIKFNATAPWTATVSGIAVRSGSDVEWLTLNTYQGKAGEQTLTLTLLPNTTGLDRKAEIKISCGGTTITITVEQKGVTQSGEKPQPTSVYITAAGKITGGEIFGKNTPTTLQWAMRSTNGNQEVLSSTTFPYANKNFDITLPVPSANLLGAITDYPGLIITPSDAKFTSAVLYDQHTELELTNITFDNANNSDYRLKKGEGSVMFMYATTATTVSGMFTDNDGGNLKTFKFNNCQFGQGWNEMVVIAESDAATNGSTTLTVTTNNATPDFKWMDTRPAETVISDYIYDERTDQTYAIGSFIFDSREAGNNRIYLDIFEENKYGTPILTVWLNKQGLPSANIAGVYTFSETPTSNETFSIKLSTIGAIASGTITIEKQTIVGEYGGGYDEYKIVIDAKESGGKNITGVIKGQELSYPHKGKGELAYSYNNAKCNIGGVVCERSASSNNFSLKFHKENWSGRQTLAFDMNVTFNKEILETRDLIGVYTFNSALTPGTFYIQKGEAENALYYVHSGSVKIEYENEKGGDLEITIDLATTTNGDGITNPGKITGVYTGTIDGITR